MNATDQGSLRVRQLRLAAVLVFVAMSGFFCDDGEPVLVEDSISTAEKLLQDGRQALGRGDAVGALQFFDALENEEGYFCEARYGQSLGHILNFFELIDPFVVLAGLVQGAQSLGDQLVAVGNFSPILFEAIAPIEAELAQLRSPLNEVIAEGCTFELREGFPIRLGREQSELFLNMVLGYEWDEAVARAVLASLETIQAVVDYLLAHRFTLGSEDANDLINQIQAAIVDAASAEQLDSSWVTAARLSGGIFDLNPLFLDFSVDSSNKSRIQHVNNDLERAFTALYSTPSSVGAEGILQALMDRNQQDAELRDNVLSLVDNGDGIFGVGDTLFFGVRALRLGSLQPGGQDVGLGTPPVSLFSFQVSGPISLTFQPGIGDVGEAWRFVEQILENLTRQMQAVEDPEVEWSRLGVVELNSIIFNLSPLATAIPQIPPFIELDFVSFFTDPKPIRALVPYWYDPDTDVTTPDVFVVEAESSLPTTEPFVASGDAGHFPPYFIFDTLLQTSISSFGNGSPLLVTDFSIPADGISPTEQFDQPLPYFAWQDPTFNGTIYIQGAEIPDGFVDTGGFILPDHWLINRALNGYLVWFARETAFAQ